MRKLSKGPYFVYVLECSDKTLYTGITINIKNRLRQHNGEIVGGAFYTKNKRPVKLIYKEEYKTHKEAIIREIAIKKLTRTQKQKLIGTH
jgi:putative endonuclease